MSTNNILINIYIYIYYFRYDGLNQTKLKLRSIQSKSIDANTNFYDAFNGCAGSNLYICAICFKRGYKLASLHSLDPLVIAFNQKEILIKLTFKASLNFHF